MENDNMPKRLSLQRMGSIIIEVDSLMSVMFGAFIMIFLAEMGDKSQFMAFSLASRYRARTVLWGVFFATLINNGAAIYIGTVFGEIINLEIVKAMAGVIFLGFGAWTLFEKREEVQNVSVKNNLGSFFPIVSLFIIAEMGDKTQIASAVYAATFKAPFLTLLGVLAGMLLADSLGIYMGYRLRDSVSINKLKIVSSMVFFILGGLNLMASALIPLNAIWLLLAFYTMIVTIYITRAKSETIL